jgi:hypothetical protein
MAQRRGPTRDEIIRKVAEDVGKELGQAAFKKVKELLTKPQEAGPKPNQAPQKPGARKPVPGVPAVKSPTRSYDDPDFAQYTDPELLRLFSGALYMIQYNTAHPQAAAQWRQWQAGVMKELEERGWTLEDFENMYAPPPMLPDKTWETRFAAKGMVQGYFKDRRKRISELEDEEQEFEG